MALEQAEGFETALRAYVQNCVDSTDSCFLGDSVDEGLEPDPAVPRRGRRTSAADGTDRDLAVGNAFYGIVFPLYNRDFWILPQRGPQSAFDGDGTTLLRLSDAYTSRTDDGDYADNRIEAFYDISCLDDPSAIPPSEVDEPLAAFEEASPTFGRASAWGLTSCLGFEARADRAAGRGRGGRRAADRGHRHHP